MEWTLVWIVGVVIVAMMLMRRIASASPEMLRKHLADGALVIDVRSPEEFRRDHVPGALNIPLYELRDQVPQQVPDKDKVLLLHCLSGMRSLNGLRQLQRLGYKNVFNLGSLARAKQIVNAPLNR
jgi:phage shock protein E